MSGSAALALAFASVLTGALNYLFQVHAAALLDAPAFGLLSSWIAQVTLLGAVSTVVQFVSLDRLVDEARFRRLLRAAGFASLAVLAAHLGVGSRAPRLVLGASAVAGAVVLFAVIGQLQARLRLGDVAVVFLATSLARFALPFGWPPAARAPGFYVAHASAAFAGIVAAFALVALRSAGRAAPAAHQALPSAADKRVRLGRPALLAFATVLFPFLDILVISATHDAATIGAFSRVALAARIVFFGGAVVLQIVLPYQMHVARTGEARPPLVLVMERWLLPVLLGGALVLAAALDRVLLRPVGEERVWLFATCAGAALLVAILLDVQRCAAHGMLRAAAASVVGVLLATALAAQLAALGGAGSVARYALAAMAGDAVVLLVARANQRNSRSVRPGVSSRR